MNYRLCYARVSTHAQDPQLQLHALTAAGVDRVYVDHLSGVATRRPELDQLLDNARPGNTIPDRSWPANRIHCHAATPARV